MAKNNFDYAISIPPVITDIKPCLEMVKNTPFRLIELPGNWLETPSLTESIESSEFHICGVTDLIASSVSSSIADQNDNIINGFIEKLLLLLHQLERCNIKNFSLNLGLETSFANQITIDSRISLLKRISPYLYRKKLKLTIPVRVPPVTLIPKGKYGTLLRGTMSSDIRLALNIHPHETAVKVKPDETIKEFRFHIENFTFVYEPETGNTLVERLIAPWLKELTEINYKGYVTFRPRVSNLDNLQTAINNISSLLNLK